MKRLLGTVGIFVLFVATCSAQRQLPRPPQPTMSTQQFRQVLIDLGSYIDAHKHTNFRQQFEQLTDEQIGYILPSVQDPGKLQYAVTRLRQNDARHANSLRLRPQTSVRPQVAFSAGCAAGAIIDTATGSACTPNYPDPNNSAWQSLVNPLITFGAFDPSDYPDVSSQQCSLTVESNLAIVVAALNGTVTAASIGCGALPPVASNVCFGTVAAIAVPGAVSQGLLADCVEQDGNVNSAEIDAAFHNSVTIFNALGTDFNLLNTGINTVSGQVTKLDTHLTNVDTHIANEFATLNATLNQLFTQLSNQVTQSTALTTAELRQVMKLQLTPDGLKVINPAILTCTGTNCPNVLNRCPAAGCSWSNVGPLP